MPTAATLELIQAAHARRQQEFAALAATRNADGWPYTMTDEDIAHLVEEYGYRLDVNATWSQAHKPKHRNSEYPFYRLSADGLWHRVW